MKFLVPNHIRNQYRLSANIQYIFPITVHANTTFGGILLNRNIEYILTVEVNIDQHISFPLVME